MVIRLDVQISAVRWSAPNEGAIAVGTPFGEHPSNFDFAPQGVTSAISIRMLAAAVGRERVVTGDTWHLEGDLETYRGLPQIRADRATLLQPVPRVMVDTLAGPRFPGVGPVKARALVDAFGDGLGSLLSNGDLASLTQVVSAEVARVLIEGWRALCPSEVIRWLDRHRMPVQIARRLVEFYGASAAEKLQEDPYRLLAFGEPWNKVDAIARTSLSVSDSDARREHAAVAEVLFRAYDREGSTALGRAVLVGRVAELLNGPAQQAEGALDACPAEAGWVHDQERDLYQSRGPWFMERSVETRLARMLDGEEAVQKDAFAPAQNGPSYTWASARGFLDEWEARNQPLGEEQRRAVQLALMNAVSVISGGAGVGKTTLLNALYSVWDRLGVRVVQMALAGRAARRMRDATGRPALTIAAFLNQGSPDPGVCTYVVDEASMLGIATLYRILRRVGPGSRLLLVGDQMQLPPIEAGLTFHQFCSAGSRMPRVHLSRVFRQAGVTGIPHIADAIRNGCWPEIPDYSGPKDGVSCLRCEPGEQASAVARLYDDLVRAEADEDEVQILSLVTGARRETPESVTAINKDLYARRLGGRRPVLLTTGHSGFCEGCPVMFLENDHERGLNNGSVGRIIEAAFDPVPGAPVCRATLDGHEHALTEDDFAKHRVVRAFSMTVHKAQGSQWNRVIVPIASSVLLDRSLVYTAVTRAVRQVVLVGDASAAAAAVSAAPRAHDRIVAFGF